MAGYAEIANKPGAHDRNGAPLVYILLLNWNGWQDTLDCLKSLHTLSYPNYQLVVVDNASTDDSEEHIRAAEPGICILQAEANLGFAGGNNIGIRHALASGAEYVWLLNNDTIVDSGALSALVSRAQLDASIGFVGSKILYAHQPHLVWFAGGKVMPHNGAAGHEPAEVPDNDNLPPPQITAYVTACSVLARREVIEEIGGLPEQYFLYYEDVDWQFVGRRHDWVSFDEPKSVVWHKVSATVRRALPSTRAAFHIARSRIIFVRRHFHALCRAVYSTRCVPPQWRMRSQVNGRCVLRLFVDS